ncbi:MAG: hypothetical protein H0U13_00365 [Gemmatimonadaceae bacterium]|nr:hypothetical protein [Gemmatimonadaceae bacterium]
MVSWLIAGLGLLLALLALYSVRRLSRRLDGLNQSYWELRYDYTRLRSRLSRLDPDGDPSSPEAAGEEPSTAASPRTAGPRSATLPGDPSVTYVPLSTIRKKEH